MTSGGHHTSYGYPTDPINNSDTTGQWACGWCKKAARWAKRDGGAIATVGAIGVCAFTAGTGCAFATAAAFAVRAQQRGRGRWRESVGDGLVTVATFGAGGAFRYGGSAAGRGWSTGRKFARSRGYAAASFGVNGPALLSNANYLTGYPRARRSAPTYHRAPAHRSMLRRGWDY